LIHNEFPLQACQHQLSFGHRQTKVGNIAEVIGAVDLHDVDPLLLAVSPNFHQPHSPSHAFAPNQRPDAKYPSSARTPNVETVPIEQGVRSCLAILRLATRYPVEQMDAACVRAMSAGASSSGFVEHLLKSGRPLVEPVAEDGIGHHGNIRGPGYYH
jgi:hypothetical protein